MKANIKIDGNTYEVPGGLTNVQQLYDLVGCDAGRLYFKRSGDIDIPLDSTNFLVINGDESFVTGDSPLEYNPSLGKPIRLKFNGKIGPEISKAKISGKDLKAFDTELPEGRLYVDIDDATDAEIADDMRILIQERNSFFVIPGGKDSEFGDPIDVVECFRHGRTPPRGQKYRIRIDQETYVVNEEKVTGTQILALAGKTPADWALNQKFRGGRRERIKADDVVDVSQPGVERFETVRRQAQQGRERSF